MLKIGVILLWLFPVFLSAKGIDEVRSDFHQVDGEKKLMAFLEMVKQVDDTRSIPYKIAASMQQAIYTSNPFQKLKYFNQGKRELEAYIFRHPQNIEGYYVRFLIQSEAPGFLGYGEKLEHDYLYVSKHLSTASLPESYKQQIMATMNKLSQKQKP
ncbi:hypothetical protein [Carboxylicivirga taeanensis]|uniref:hypothetical protein n=1 Tax=Carboxylicivirga taeanensis TaxID=1416875 RepID=UPI003F6E404A